MEGFQPGRTEKVFDPLRFALRSKEEMKEESKNGIT
jgi:hypothetical protein